MMYAGLPYLYIYSFLAEISICLADSGMNLCFVRR